MWLFFVTISRAFRLITKESIVLVCIEPAIEIFNDMGIFHAIELCSFSAHDIPVDTMITPNHLSLESLEGELNLSRFHDCLLSLLNILT